MLSQLPTEIIGLILEFISRYDTNQLSRTCKSIYRKSLPFLYAHLELGLHTHLRQLRQGTLQNLYLKQIIIQHTRKLTLRSRQNSNQWRARDLISILTSNSKIQTLVFCDFQALSTDTIHRTISILPHLYKVQYQYCHIIYNNNKILDVQTSINTTKVDQLSLSWTDFTQKCIPYTLFPKITRLELGSNRNKYDKINSLIVQSLYSHCPLITHLTITLPQVSSLVLCNTIASYGSQLLYLSVQCDNLSTLESISNYATNLETLSIRATSKNALDYAMTSIFYKCQKLKQLEVISYHLERHVPDAIWESMGGQESMLVKRRERKNNTTIQTHPSIAGSIWFYTVSEEALQQRAHYLQTFPGYKKQKVLKSIILNQNDILKIKTRLNIC